MAILSCLESRGRDKIVRRPDDFPKLMQALRDGDLATGRRICAQLFGLDLDAKTPPRRGNQAAAAGKRE
ncbi:MAG TPA: hypothetical protein VLY22_00015 [Candidatus Nitrosotalea sp.]|nr:hypothetical protein [Candidatus Nitrosotalea sp.]